KDDEDYNAYYTSSQISFADPLTISCDNSLLLPGTADSFLQTAEAYVVGNSEETNISMECWFSPNAEDRFGRNEHIISRGDDASSAKDFALYINPDGQIVAQFGSYATLTSTTVVERGEIYHVVAVSEDAFQGLYVNNVLEDSDTENPGVITETYPLLLIG